MNLPNKLSIGRVILIPVMVALLYLHTLAGDLMAAAVFAIASLTDFLDGYIARKYNLVTSFGKFVDPLADKLLVLSALVMMVERGLLPGFVPVIILARELAVDGLRMIAVTKGQVIAAGPLGKIKTVSQIVLVLWLMILRIPVGSHWTGLVICAVVLVMTLWSGVDYFVRNGRCIMETK